MRLEHWTRVVPKSAVTENKIGEVYRSRGGVEDAAPVLHEEHGGGGDSGGDDRLHEGRAMAPVGDTHVCHRVGSVG